MTTTKAPATSTVDEKTFYYRFDLQRNPFPLEPFQPLSEAQMENNPESFLARFQFELLNQVSEFLTFYHSTTCSDAYLAIVHASDAHKQRYRLVFFIRDDHAWVEWKRVYGEYLHRLLTMPGILPEPPADALKNHKIIHLDKNMVRNMGGHY